MSRIRDFKRGVDREMKELEKLSRYHSDLVARGETKRAGRMLDTIQRRAQKINKTVRQVAGR